MVNVSERVANDAFSPYHGTEEMIQSFPKKNGAVYFAYDTRKIFFDVNGNRYQMSGNGILFVYGDTPVEELIVNPETGLYPFPRENIEQEYYEEGSIIINSDNTFYKIVFLDDVYAHCEKLLIAGGGGGGGGSSDDEPQFDTSLVLSVRMPQYHPYGTTCTGVASVVDTRGGYGGTLYFKIYNSAEEYKAGFAPRVQKRIPFVCGEPFDVILEAEDLVGGEGNFFYAYAEVNLRESAPETGTINCVDLHFEPTAQWNPVALLDTTKGDIMFPYQVYAGEGSKIPSDLSVNVTYTLIENSGITHEYIPDPVTSTLGEHNLYELINSAPQGGHALTVYATVLVGNTTVVIGDYYYGIGVYKHITTGNQAAPIIWSPYNETEVENYTIIEIPYNVFDPTRNDGKAFVEFYVNGDEQVSQTIQYRENEWHIWTIADYLVEQMNLFVIQCGLSWKEFQVYIKKNLAVNLDSTVGSALYLNALGRSNLETPHKREKWPNKGTVEYTNFGLGDVIFKNFNWSNNGWISDPQEGACLRVSNGASVEIPLTAMTSASAANRTYEFDFKVRNAVDYSRLIIEKAVPDLDENGNKQYDEDGTLKTKQEKTVSSGEGAFLTYFNPDNYRGFMLGTQEAFFSLSQTSVVNARYTDDKRVKISIVVDAEGKNTPVYNENGVKTGNIKLIYIYVNSVLTNIMAFTDNDKFDNAVSKITINSEYCDVDIFNIRVYPEALSYSQITQNWIGDAPTLEERHARYNRNNAIVENNKIDYTLVRKANIIPTMVITTYNDISVGSMADNKLPYQKGNKKTVGIRYWDPSDPSKGFHCQNVELDVQGTSSQGYPRRNYKLKTKEFISLKNVPNWKIPFKFEYWDGNDNQKDYWYQDEGDNSKKLKKLDIGNGVKVSTFCLKADYMESSSTHNTQFANLIQTIANGSGDAVNLRHPLNKDFEETGSFRTTVYGFPILVFWEDADGNIEFVGKYNFNLDKGATDAFGFSCKGYNECTPKIERDTIVEVDAKDEDGNVIMDEETGKPKKVEEIQKKVRHATYAEVAECWEFRQNQTGLGKFQGDKGFYETIPLTEENPGKLQIFNHFEPRYTYEDWDIKKDVYNVMEVGVANQFIKDHTTNLKVMWDWVNSTDTTKANPATQFDSPVYYLTLSMQREPKINYYKLDEEGYYNPIELEAELQAAYQTLSSSDNANNVVVKTNTTFAEFLSHVNDPLTSEETAAGMHIYEKYEGPYTFVKHDDGLFYYETEIKDWEAIAECGLAINEAYSRDTFTIEVSVNWKGFSGDLFERFDYDTVRYRKAKFRNEFTEHFDLNYSAIYFIMTELLLCYDSRQKNMMIATWGPTPKSNANNDYIWYPIFYDIDTQLGVNNSGHVSWDYNTDATIITEDENGAFIDSSIFSGAGSVLWINFAGLMMDKVQNIYRSLRNAGAIDADVLTNHYNLKGSDAWSEIMKNIDADYKYISPATTGYIDQEGGRSQTQGYFYCLQGDRALSREAFFRNRLNYLDSQWLGGAYNPDVAGKQIKLRYNANDLARTSDNTAENGELVDILQASANFELRSFLSQYLSVVYDETATTPQRYTAGQESPVVVNPPSSIQTRLDDGIPLSQQLAYIRGPEYISDLGDLSDKYINEIDYSQAKRLRTFTLGSLHEKYRNDGITEAMTATLGIPATAPKGLLNYMNLSNLNKLAGSLDLEGCEKLETFMGTGTSLSSVTFTNGNMLKTLYLPETVNSFVLEQPLELEGLLPTAPTLGNTPEGLYIKNLTDKLGTTPNASTSCRINTFAIDQGKFGVDSYRMLDYLYKVKEAKYNGTITDENTTYELICDLLGVEWSPYTRVEADLPMDFETKYYELKNNSVYEIYHNPDTGESYYSGDSWRNKTNDGVIYTFNENFDTDVIKNLDIIDAFLEMYLDETKVIKTDNPVFKYRYKSRTEDLTNDEAKILPGLTGRMHVNNLEGGDALDEYTVWNYYNKHYPELEITADHMNPAYSVQFVEYSPEGIKETLEWVKYPYGKADSPAVYSKDEPTRLHYDFKGWAVDTTDTVDGFNFRDSHSIITDTDDITLYQTKDLSTVFSSLAGVENGRLTLVAVYKVHGYKMNFYNYDGSPFQLNLETPAGKPIITPQAIPQRDSSGLDLFDCYRFIGWHTSQTSSGETTDLSRVLANDDMNFFAVFEVTSVYNSVIDQKYLNIEWKNDPTNGTYAVVGLKTEYGLGGKICLPIKVMHEDGNEYPIRELAAGGSLDESITNGFMGNPDLQAIFFLGCQENASEPSEISVFNDNCFDGAANLVYVDIPDSLTSVGSYCFRGCQELVIDSTNNISYFGNNAFRDCANNSKAIELVIPLAEKPNVNGYTFRNAGWSLIYLGTKDKPLNLINMGWLSGMGYLFGCNDSTVRLNTLTITYDTNTISDQSQIESHLDEWIENYQLHYEKNPNMVQFIGA